MIRLDSSEAKQIKDLYHLTESWLVSASEQFSDHDKPAGDCRSVPDMQEAERTKQSEFFREHESKIKELIHASIELWSGSLR